MRVVRWLTSILAVSIALGAFFFVASGFVAGGNRELEGLLGLVMLVSMIGTLSSGVFLLMIGPTAIVDHFRETRVREACNGAKRLRQTAIALVALATAIAWPTMSLVAQDSSVSVPKGPVVPDALRYIFDLPWCARWRFTCVVCEKGDAGITCQKRSEACDEKFSYYKCVRYNLPKGCIVWRDGCNNCGKISDLEISCTLNACEQYSAPNKPSFECLRFEPT
jgi:hypothetical protein